VNMSYAGGSPNSMGTAMKAEGVTVHTHVGVSQTDKKDIGDGRTVMGDSPSPAAVDKKLMSNIAAKNDNEQPPMRDPNKKKVPMNKGEEYLDLFKNGQWEIKKCGEVMSKDAADPKLAPKDKKVKMLQQKIDAGTYKPDSNKIAGAMLKKSDEELEKSVYNAGMHPMKGREPVGTRAGSEFELDHGADYENNFKAAHSHYKNMGMKLDDDRIHNILKRKGLKKN
jgi:anti-sigma28 factor (negative regulator of flagellin synthesis)